MQAEFTAASSIYEGINIYYKYNVNAWIKKVAPTRQGDDDPDLNRSSVVSHPVGSLTHHHAFSRRVSSRIMVATPAGKTKAKQRYLKKKKERRKHNTAKKTQDVVEPTLRAKKEPKRPKKKQRVEEEQLDGQEEDVEVIQVDDEDAMKDTEADEEPMADLGVEEDATETVEQQADDVMVDINEDIADPPALEVNAPFPTFSFPTPPSLPPPKTRLDLPSATIIPNTSSLPLTSLPQNIATRLQDQGITKLSAVQSKIVPHLLHAPLYTSYSPQSDICVSAPTGSGKTLAYAIPIVHVRRNLRFVLLLY